MRRPRLTMRALVLLLTACGASPTAPPTAAVASAPATAGDPGAGHAVGADSVRILGAGEATFAELGALILGARTSIDVEVYEFGRADLVADLVAAHRRGVAVTVIADPSERTTAATAARLRAAGVDVLDYPVRSRMIDHVKLLVVDATVAVVGGINWGKGSYANHDFDGELRGPAVANLERVFRLDLVTCGRPLAVVPPLTDPAVVVAVTLPGAEIRPLVLGVIDATRSTLDVAMYTLTDPAVVEGMERAAARGVRVRVLLDPSERPSDPSATSLRAHGVAVELYRSAGEKLHAKAAIADAATVVFGSANWTLSGFGHNHELDIEIPSAPAVAAELGAPFAADWAASG